MTHTNVAIVTGGSAGIGAEICRSMLDAGYEVISMARRAADFSHPRLHNMQVDLLDATATAQAGARPPRGFPSATLSTTPASSGPTCCRRSPRKNCTA